MKNKRINRRKFIKDTTTLTAAASLAPSFSIGKSVQLSEEIIGHGNFTYRVHKGWGNLDSVKYPINNCHEMIMDSRGRLIMIGDNTNNNIVIYGKSGKILDYWGVRYGQGHAGNSYPVKLERV